jgi:uncharacterized protein (TIGR02594 family)
MKPYEIALLEYGVKGIVGDKHNPRVIKYSVDIGNDWVKTDEVAWCSEFVNWCLLQAGIKGTKSAVAHSFLTWGEETKAPRLGDIVVFWREPKGSRNGHVGFYIKDTDTGIWTLGGNQNNAVNIKEISKETVLSYRRVPERVTIQDVMNLWKKYLNTK